MQPFLQLPIYREAAEPCDRQQGCCPCGAADRLHFAASRCTTMNTGFSRIEWKGLAGHGGGFFGWSRKPAITYMGSGLVWLPLALIAGFGAWMLVSGYDSKPAESEPVQLATAIMAEPDQAIPVSDPPAATAAPSTPAAVAPVDGLKISSQSWRRGGLGANALVTFTLRNGNDYAVKDIEISCAFSRRDGSHLTDRVRTIHDTVNTRSRKTFARLHVGFVNVNADKAKCALVAASHI
jgi:hypothetical protein